MSRQLLINIMGRHLLVWVAGRQRALLPALAFALFCAHLPADVFAGERATPTVLGIWGDYQPSTITRWVPVSLLSFAKDSGKSGGGSSGSGKDDKDKKEKKDKDKDKKKEKDKDKDKKKDKKKDNDKCEDKHKEKNKDKCKKKDKKKDKDKCKDKHKEKHKDKCKKKDRDKDKDEDEEDRDDEHRGEEDKDKDEADDNGDDEDDNGDDEDHNEEEEGASDEQEDGDGQVVEDAGVDPGVSPAVVASGAELTITGTSAETIVALERYSFRPTTAGSIGDSVLAYSISGGPPWAVFNELTGELSGTPEEADVGLYQAIAISVTDGGSSASLAPFSIEVIAIGAATGSVTLSWTPPTENEDGTPLMDLAGYRIYWGQPPATNTKVMNFDNPGLSRVVIDNLLPGTYEFVATSLNGAGVESRFSNAITRIVQ